MWDCGLSSVHYCYCSLSVNVFQVGLSLWENECLYVVVSGWLERWAGWRVAGEISLSLAPATHHVTSPPQNVKTGQCLRQAQPRQEEGQVPGRGRLRGPHQGERWRRHHEHAEEGQCRHRSRQDQHGRHDSTSPGTSPLSVHSNSPQQLS